MVINGYEFSGSDWRPGKGGFYVTAYNKGDEFLLKRLHHPRLLSVKMSDEFIKLKVQEYQDYINDRKNRTCFLSVLYGNTSNLRSKLFRAGNVWGKFFADCSKD